MKISIKKIMILFGGLIFCSGLLISLTFNVFLAPSIEIRYSIPVNQPYGVWGENGSLIDASLYIPKSQYL